MTLFMDVSLDVPQRGNAGFKATFLPLVVVRLGRSLPERIDTPVLQPGFIRNRAWRYGVVGAVPAGGVALQTDNPALKFAVHGCSCKAAKL